MGLDGGEVDFAGVGIFDGVPNTLLPSNGDGFPKTLPLGAAGAPNGDCDPAAKGDGDPMDLPKAVGILDGDGEAVAPNGDAVDLNGFSTAVVGDAGAADVDTNGDGLGFDGEKALVDGFPNGLTDGALPAGVLGFPNGF